MHVTKSLSKVIHCETRFETAKRVDLIMSRRGEAFPSIKGGGGGDGDSQGEEA